MRPFVVRPISRLRGEVILSGDKSIAHRSIIISALSPGLTRIENFPTNKDCLFTLKAFQRLGIKIKVGPSRVEVRGKGLYGLNKPGGAIFVGNSGTTLRLLLGVLAGQDFPVTLRTGESLSLRPMLRVTVPLRMMGARIISKIKYQKSPAKAGSRKRREKLEEYPPIAIKGGNLRPITYKMPVASAQVKSAILLAALYAKGKTSVTEYIPTRDHTERMLKLFKADIKVDKNTIVINGNRELVSPKKIYIPGDISSAAFFLVLATMVPNSQILIKNVSLNPSRIGIIKVLKRMGADIEVSKYQSVKVSKFEPMGDIIVKTSALKGTVVKKGEIPSLIDELPILMVAACGAKGRTVFDGVGELRVKETDRVRSMSENLKRMGSNIVVSRGKRSERIIIQGTKKLKGAKVRGFGDHRTAMSLVIAGLLADGSTQIDDVSCISKSFPNFISLLQSLKH